MKPTSLIFALLLCISVSGQQQKVDSILKLLNPALAPDTTTLVRLKWLSFCYQDVDLDRGIRIADSAILVARRMGEKGKYLAGLYNSLGVNYSAKGENVKARHVYGEAQQIFAGLKDKTGLANIQANLANTWMRENRFDSGAACLSEAIRMYHETGNVVNEMTLYNNLGVLYQYISNFQKALECYYKVQLYCQQTGNDEGLAAAYVNLGITNKSLENLPASLAYYEKALAIWKRIGAKQSEAEILENIGNTYYEMNDTQNALSTFQRALKLSEETGSKISAAACHGNMAQLYADLKQYDKAFASIQKGMQLYQETGKEDILIYNTLSKLIFTAPDDMLQKYGVPLSQRYTKAIEYAKKSLELAKEAETLDNQYYAWENLSQIYEKQKDYSSALYAYKQFSSLQDSVFEVKKLQLIARQEAQNEADIERLKARAENEKTRLVTERRELKIKLTIIFVSLLAIISLLFYYLYNRKRNMARVAEAEMSMLRTQMKPHFVFNAMSSINAFSIEQGSGADLRKYVAKFGTLTRMVLDASIHKYICIAKDIEILELYLQLEQRRTDNKFQYLINVDPAISKETTMVTPMTLQPFAENSIWHGFAPEGKSWVIEVNIRRDNKRLYYTIRDNGIGRKEAAKRKSTVSLLPDHEPQGLKNTKRRIDLLNAENDVSSSLKIADLEKGTEVEIILPYKESRKHDKDYYCG